MVARTFFTEQYDYVAYDGTHLKGHTRNITRRSSIWLIDAFHNGAN